MKVAERGHNDAFRSLKEQTGVVTHFVVAVHVGERCRVSRCNPLPVCFSCRDIHSRDVRYAYSRGSGISDNVCDCALIHVSG